MNAFAYLEKGAGWRPRHPVVCMLDIIGFAMAATLLIIYQPRLTAAALPLAVMLQYAVSCLFHWMPYALWRSKLDRSVIFMLIGATYVPYWGGLLPEAEAFNRLAWVAAAVVIGIGVLLGGATPIAVGIFWAVFSCAGLVISFYEFQSWLPPHALALFWFGSFLYGAQQAVFSLKRPDPMPELFGFREVQHTILLVATTIGSSIALNYT